MLEKSKLNQTDSFSLKHFYVLAVLSFLPIFNIFAFMKIRQAVINNNFNEQQPKTIKQLYYVCAVWMAVYIAALLSLTIFYVSAMLGFSFIVSIIIALMLGMLSVAFFITGIVNKDISFKSAFLLASLIVIAVVLGIIVFIFIRGLPIFREVGVFRFVFGRTWFIHPFDYSLNVYGVFPMIMGTFIAAIGALIIGGGFGILTALFISRFCPKKIKPFITQAVNMLAGIPSVVYGFFGLRFIVPIFNSISPNGSGTGPLVVAIILGIMIMPMVVALSRASLDAVDKSYYEGAVALGASDSTAVFKAVVPGAKSGILASLILGLGRAVGETMAVIMVAGNAPGVIPIRPFDSFRTLTTNIVFEMSYASPGTSHFNAMLGTGVVLLATVLLINLVFNLVKSSNNSRSPIKRFSSFLKAKLIKQSAINDDNESIELNNTVQQKHGDANSDFNHSQNKNFNDIAPANYTAGFPVFLKVLSFIAAGFAIVALSGITIYILANGLGHLNGQLLTGEFSFGGPRTIAPSIVSTLMVILLAGIIAFPLGIAAAIFLSEYTKKGSKLAKTVELAIETLAGIPSILYGMFGGIFFVVFMGLGPSITAGSLTMALMLLPITVRATQESLKSVPDSFREGSLALGADKARTIFRVIIPSALPGIIAMIILGVGRVVAETAALMFTMGGSMGAMPDGYSSSSTTLAVAFYRMTESDLWVNEAYATASILIIVIFTLNIFATLIAGRLRKKRST